MAKTDDGSFAQDKTRTRSPSHPTFGLDVAIERARGLYNNMHDHFVPLQAIADEWESNTKSSAFMQAISTLLQFGLLEDRGRGDQRQARISDLAKTIFIRDDDPASTERIQAVKAAALHPKLYLELWEKFRGQLPQSDSPIRAYLLQGRTEGTFNKDQVDTFIRHFRGTVDFAGLSASDTILPAGDTSDLNKVVESKPKDWGRQGDGEPPARRRKMAGTKEAVLPLDAGGEVVITWPESMGEEDAEEVEDWMEMMKKKLARATRVAKPKTERSVSASARDDPRESAQEGDG